MYFFTCVLNVFCFLDETVEHPLQFVPLSYRKQFFFTFLFLTLVLFAVFRVLDQPLQTDAAPNGIVSFELAGNTLTTRAITDSWKQLSLLLSATRQPNPDIVNVAYVFAAFGLGLDYLFMPIYALALGFATLLVTQKHAGWLHSLAVVAAYGAFTAALFERGGKLCLVSDPVGGGVNPVIRKLPRFVRPLSLACLSSGSWLSCLGGYYRGRQNSLISFRLDL